jgi:hypothetical protein
VQQKDELADTTNRLRLILSLPQIQNQALAARADYEDIDMERDGTALCEEMRADVERLFEVVPMVLQLYNSRDLHHSLMQSTSPAFPVPDDSRDGANQDAIPVETNGEEEYEGASEARPKEKRPEYAFYRKRSRTKTRTRAGGTWTKLPASETGNERVLAKT